jgi:hypothetical protein
LALLIGDRCAIVRCDELSELGRKLAEAERAAKKWATFASPLAIALVIGPVCSAAAYVRSPGSVRGFFRLISSFIVTRRRNTSSAGQTWFFAKSKDRTQTTGILLCGCDQFWEAAPESTKGRHSCAEYPARQHLLRAAE